MTVNSFNPQHDFFISNTGTLNFSDTLNSNGSVGISNQQKPRSISIEPKANGYTLGIGCQTFVFESLDSMVYRIHEYYTNPAEVELHFQSTNKLPITVSKKDKKLN